MSRPNRVHVLAFCIVAVTLSTSLTFTGVDTISTAAGNGVCCGAAGDGGAATAAELYLPHALSFNLAGDMFIADWVRVTRNIAEIPRSATCDGIGLLESAPPQWVNCCYLHPAALALLSALRVLCFVLASS